MKVILHLPDNEAAKNAVAKKIAGIHVEGIMRYLESVSLTMDQKLTVIEWTLNAKEKNG